MSIKSVIITENKNIPLYYIRETDGWNQDKYIVRCVIDGVVDEQKTYYTDDYQDAIDTMKVMKHRDMYGWLKHYNLLKLIVIYCKRFGLRSCHDWLVSEKISPDQGLKTAKKFMVKYHDRLYESNVDSLRDKETFETFTSQNK